MTEVKALSRISGNPLRFAAWTLFLLMAAGLDANRLNAADDRHIATYRGYGNAETVRVMGRLLEGDAVYGPEEEASWWDNLKASYARWETDEIEDARVELHYARNTKAVTTDDEGYYFARFDRSDALPGTSMVIAVNRAGEELAAGVHDITLPDPRADYMIISDVDDTVIHTGNTSLLRSARLTFFHNAHSRKPLPGVAGLYREFHDAGGEGRNPVFYVSNSAWNLYDLLVKFMTLNELPRGPLFLRDLGLFTDTSDHKIETLRHLMQFYSPLPAILIGDSGQHDASLYADLAREYPDRILAVYIRDVDPGDDSEYDEKVDRIIGEVEEAGVDFLRVQDSTRIAAHAAALGLLPESAVVRVRHSVEHDGEGEELAQADPE